MKKEMKFIGFDRRPEIASPRLTQKRDCPGNRSLTVAAQNAHRSRDRKGAVGAVVGERSFILGNQAGPSTIRFAATLLIVGTLAITAAAATRPRYGGTLRIEIHASIETADPPQLGPGMPDLAPAFSITRWEAGRRAAFAADENAPGGRPFLDAVEVELARPPRDQAIDLDVGKAEMVEIPPSEARRQPAGRRTWVSQPVRVVLLDFGARVDDPRVREALALAVDRTAIFNVLLQRQGEISGALLPQWLSGYAFLFNAASDAARARALAASVPAQARSLSIGVEDPALRPIAERIALNARDAGLAVSWSRRPAWPMRACWKCASPSADPAHALAAMASRARPPGAAARTDSPDALYNAERALLDGFRVVPLFHLTDVYGVAARVKGAPGISPLGEWRMENVWLEGGRP
jgi:hypothetical protein